MTAKEIFNIDGKGYLSRSRHGMRSGLILLGYSFEAADELITSWITDGSITPTPTPDDHFNLSC